jgi:hypothetical protein
MLLDFPIVTPYLHSPQCITLPHPPLPHFIELPVAIPGLTLTLDRSSNITYAFAPRAARYGCAYKCESGERASRLEVEGKG